MTSTIQEPGRSCAFSARIPVGFAAVSSFRHRDRPRRNRGSPIRALLGTVDDPGRVVDFSDPLALDSVRIKAVLAEHAAAPLMIVVGTFAPALLELIAVATLTTYESPGPTEARGH
ncbi:hypothetical protein [Streptomyces sp. NBC_00356]|uniref:hypothetical protein n=1 Tax=Streptomyces sp. NBC_00356 TaxID=2975724 RepID=UPI002E27387D